MTPLKAAVRSTVREANEAAAEKDVVKSSDVNLANEANAAQISAADICCCPDGRSEDFCCQGC